MTAADWIAVLLPTLIALVGVALGLWLFVVRRRDDGAERMTSVMHAQDRLERLFSDESTRARQELAKQFMQQRGELSERLHQFQQQFVIQQEAARLSLAERLEGFASELRAQNQRLAEHQREFIEQARVGRQEQSELLARFSEQQLVQGAALRASVEENLKTLRQENTDKLEQMRRTVDEKLHETLERRLGESFKQVQSLLENVHKDMGEMRSLASGVGDLKRVLTNVKSRGIFGEVQLAALLEQVLTIEQYAVNIATKPGSDARIEFAIKLPGRGDDSTPVWLPIDAKFPREDYERLIEAQERVDPEAAAAAAAALERRIRIEAQTIAEKYLSPPHTTDFAILFVPVEGLYAEVLRRPGLFEELQRRHRVTVAGPSNLLAFLNSLQMGFRTLALEKRSSEVWQVLGAVKTEFDKFGDVLDKVRKKLDEASNQLDSTGARTRAITRRLKTVQALPESESERLLGSAADPDEDER